MPADITLTGNITGLSSIGGNLGPASFSYALNNVTKFHTQEIPVPLGAAALSVTVPDVGTQRLFYLETTQDVTVTLNAEPAGLVRAGGLVVRSGMANVATISFDGNGAVDAVVWLVVVGD